MLTIQLKSQKEQASALLHCDRGWVPLSKSVPLSYCSIIGDGERDLEYLFLLTPSRWRADWWSIQVQWRGLQVVRSGPTKLHGPSESRFGALLKLISWAMSQLMKKLIVLRWHSVITSWLLHEKSWLQVGVGGFSWFGGCDMQHINSAVRCRFKKHHFVQWQLRHHLKVNLDLYSKGRGPYSKVPKNNNESDFRERTYIHFP